MGGCWGLFGVWALGGVFSWSSQDVKLSKKENDLGTLENTFGDLVCFGR